ncbi:protein kinase domain-containing protein [Streptomyces lateritius]|uniref:protein kinase domain-containing protein n=1 Tax=Streptomyces lateritius TaxID=67313 RepID=UPI001C8BA043|nr:lipopolysaccharide kinase InaA family protein [Streptomyces lateritius]MBX9422203.1 serine/threonine protein kinase [Streptomyces lateritius]
MKKGDTIAGYRIVTDKTNANGGKCVWAFAEKDGVQYFIKQFLEPKRPRDDAADSASVRIRREVAREFEQRHRKIMKRLRPDTLGGGNLVLATDFFYEGSTYYKVTERIDTSSLDQPDTLEPRPKMVLLKTLGASLKQLHETGTVHGDLKPLNVLVQKREGAAFHSARLIDFDDSYDSGDPPKPDDISGDSVYGAPEWRRYLQDDGSAGPKDLTCAVDIFALGLMTHLYVVGHLPSYDERFGSPADAVNAGEELRLDPRLSDELLGLLRRMTAADPRTRPDVSVFLATLADPAVCTLQHRRPGTTAPGVPAPRPGSATTSTSPPASGERRPSRIKSSFGRRKETTATPPPAAPAPTPPPPAAEKPVPAPAPAPAAEPEAAPSPAPGTSRVRINLGGRRGDRRTP